MMNNQNKAPYDLGRFTAAEAENLRFLRTNFLTAAKKAERETKTVLCVTDADSEGLARGVIGLACALAAVDKKVLVLDIDRKNAQANALIGKNGKTFNDYLEGNATVDELCSKTSVDGLDVIVSEVSDKVGLKDDSMASVMMTSLRERYDFVFVIATAAKQGSDAFTYDEFTDSILLFVKKGRTNLSFVDKMKSYYEGRGQNITGTVII